MAKLGIPVTEAGFHDNQPKWQFGTKIVFILNYMLNNVHIIYPKYVNKYYF